MGTTERNDRTKRSTNAAFSMAENSVRGRKDKECRLPLDVFIVNIVVLLLLVVAANIRSLLSLSSVHPTREDVTNYFMLSKLLRFGVE
jgi:hypothetical protein